MGTYAITGRVRESLPAGRHARDITSLVRQFLSGPRPLLRRGTLGSPDLACGPAVRRPAPSIGGQRSPRPLMLDCDRGSGRGGAGRGGLGEQVGNLAPEVRFVL